MRLHIEMDNDLVRQVDEVAGTRGRSNFVRWAVEQALRQHARSARLAEAAGALRRSRHDWDADPAAWVRHQRHGDVRRGG